MFCKHSAALFFLIGLATAQTSPSDQCYNAIIGNVTQRSDSVLLNLGTLIEGATLDNLGKLVGLENEHIEKTTNYINELSGDIEQIRTDFLDCNNVACILGEGFNLLALLDTVVPSLVELYSEFLGDNIQELNNIVDLNITDLGNTINSINALRTYIATNSVAIRTCLLAEFPLFGTLLG